MPMKHILIILSLFTSLNLYAQDTLKYEDLLPKNKIELTWQSSSELLVGQAIEIPKSFLRDTGALLHILIRNI